MLNGNYCIIRESNSLGFLHFMLNKLYKAPQKSAYLIIIFLAVASTIYNVFLPLHGDEAYYWMWSHHIQAGYYDHPPMIAYMIYFSNFISQDVWGVRLVNIFSMSISFLYMYKFTKLLSDEKIALTTVLIFSSVILTHAGFIFATPDAPLTLFWTLGLYYTYKAFFEEKRRDFLLAGLFLGAMMLSKYSAILLVVAILIFALVKKRSLFLNPNFYLGSITSLLVISPMLYWNYQHDWISFLFQIGHGTTESFEIQPWLIFEFIGAQFGVFSPVFTAVLFFFLIKEKLFYKNDKLFFLALSTAVTLLFFTYKSFYMSMAPSYSAPAYISGAILLAIIFHKYELHKTFKIGLSIAIIFTLLARYVLLMHLPEVQRFMYKTKEVIAQFETHAKEGDHFYGAHLTTTAYLKFFLPGHPETDLATDDRYSQYDMWRDEKEWHKDGLVLARNTKRDGLLKKYYKDVKLIDTYIVVPNKRVFYTYRVSNPYTQDELKKREK
jgi:Dolichyl-phosphate-mannose-protein mannosyltransferase